MAAKDAVLTQQEPAAEKLAQSIETLAKILESQKASLPNLPVAAAKELKPDREALTTPEEQREYDQMIERDFIKRDKSGKNLAPGTFFRIIHIFPEFQSANPAEFCACFSVEQFKWEIDTEGAKKRSVMTSFNIKAKQFKTDYQPTIKEVASDEA